LGYCHRYLVTLPARPHPSNSLAGCLLSIVRTNTQVGAACQTHCRQSPGQFGVILVCSLRKSPPRNARTGYQLSWNSYISHYKMPHLKSVSSEFASLKTMLRAANKYAHTGCGSTAYSVGTVHGGKRDLYTPDARSALLSTPCLASLAMPVRPVGDARLALLG